MSINIQIFNSTYNRTLTVSVDFLADLVAFPEGSNINEIQYFFKISTTARDTSNKSFAPVYVRDLSDLALNKTKRSATNSGVAYEDVKTMITDYVYDFVNGHTANQFSSGCAAKAPMKFS